MRPGFSSESSKATQVLRGTAEWVPPEKGVFRALAHLPAPRDFVGQRGRAQAVGVKRRRNRLMVGIPDDEQLPIGPRSFLPFFFEAGDGQQSLGEPCQG